MVLIKITRSQGNIKSKYSTLWFVDDLVKDDIEIIMQLIVAAAEKIGVLSALQQKYSFQMVINSGALVYNFG